MSRATGATAFLAALLTASGCGPQAAGPATDGVHLSYPPRDITGSVDFPEPDLGPVGPASAAPAAPAAPAGLIRGKILAVDNTVNLVMLSVGDDDAVRKGDQFNVLRDGELVGRLIVERTFRDMCAARILIPPKTSKVIREDDDIMMRPAPARGRNGSDGGDGGEASDEAPKAAAPEISMPPPILCKVTAVDEGTGLVKLSVGSDDGVRKGYHFTVYRVDTYIGKVVVERVGQDSSEAKISVPDLAQGKKIRAGDNAATRVY